MKTCTSRSCLSLSQLFRGIGRRSPLSGINWDELRAAYRVFISDAAAGIHHILAAGRYSRWQQWVRGHLTRKARHLWGQSIPVDLEILVRLPPDSLGGAYARHMIEYGFDPKTFFTEETEVDWLDQRLAISHDVYHIITGFDAKPLGENGLAAFTLMQYGDLLNVFVLSFVPLSLTNPTWTFPLLRNLIRGFRMGIQCKPTIAYPIERHWATSLRQVREDLGISQFF